MANPIGPPTEFYGAGGLIERTQLFDDGTLTHTNPAGTVTATDPATPASLAAVTAAQGTIVATQQDNAVANLLAGAQTVLTNYAAARATLTGKITGLPATPTVAQLTTFIKQDLSAYLVADNDTMSQVIRGLANFIARQAGTSQVF